MHKNRWEFEQEIALKALKDPTFKKKLLENPKEAIAELLKGDEREDFLDRSHSFNVHVHQEKKDEWYISIPYLETKGRNLSDAELKRLAASHSQYEQPY